MNNAAFITTEQAANILSIPAIAVGQIVADNKLKMWGGFSFKLTDVENLLETELEYIESLR